MRSQTPVATSAMAIGIQPYWSCDEYSGNNKPPKAMIVTAIEANMPNRDRIFGMYRDRRKRMKKRRDPALKAIDPML